MPISMFETGNINFLGHENSLVFIIDIRCLGYSNDQGSYFVELTEQVKCED